MRKFLTVGVVLVAMTFATPVALLAQGGRPPFRPTPRPSFQPGKGDLEGQARNSAQQNMPQVKVQVRPVNPAPGQPGVTATGTTNANGVFTFNSLDPGQYIVEILDAAGNIVGTSTVSVTAGAVATVTITAAAAGIIAAGGTGLLGLGALGTVGVVAAAGVVTAAAIVATRDDSSPSR